MKLETESHHRRHRFQVRHPHLRPPLHRQQIALANRQIKIAAMTQFADFHLLNYFG